MNTDQVKVKKGDEVYALRPDRSGRKWGYAIVCLVEREKLMVRFVGKSVDVICWRGHGEWLPAPVTIVDTPTDVLVDPFAPVQGDRCHG